MSLRRQPVSAETVTQDISRLTDHCRRGGILREGGSYRLGLKSRFISSDRFDQQPHQLSLRTLCRSRSASAPLTHPVLHQGGPSCDRNRYFSAARTIHAALALSENRTASALSSLIEVWTAVTSSSGAAALALHCIVIRNGRTMKVAAVRKTKRGFAGWIQYARKHE